MITYTPTPLTHVLIIEDDPLVAAAICRTLRKLGCAVDHVTTVKSALAILHYVTPSAAVLDYDLPDGTAADIIPYLRCPHVVHTGRDPLTLRDLSCNVLSKTCTLDELITALKEV